MDRRRFLLRSGAFLGILNLGQTAMAADPKSAKKPKSKKKPKRGVAKPEIPPLPFVPGSSTLVILPDIQNYSTRYPGLTQLQTQWIVDHKDKNNIVYVLQNGDVTNGNRKWEWDRASRAFEILDGEVPYAIVPGNHDMGPGGRATDRTTLMNDYFPPSRFKDWPTFGGTMEAGHIENNYHLFEAGGKKWLIIGLEWAPRDKALQWADHILRKHTDRKALVFTHAYLYNDSTRYDWAAKGKKQSWNPHAYRTPGSVNDGEEIWNKLVKKHANVFMAMNGHVCGDGLGFQVSQGDHGNPVNEMLVDYQVQKLGGGGWLRLLEFLPDGKTVQARSYSPLYGEYKTDPQNQFRFTLG